MTEYEYHLWFCAAITDPGVRGRLMTAFGDPKGIFHAGEERLRNMGEMSAEDAGKLASTCTPDYVAKLQRSLDRRNAGFAWYKEKHYPQSLREIPDPPYGLFYQGSMPGNTRCCVAIVGTRLSSPYGDEVAHRFGRILGDAGVVVVSGLALGIDVASHRGALAGGGTTVAVLGSGIGTPYPRDNTDVYEQIVRHGCVMSEYAPGVPGLKFHFPHRNRLIAGLSDAVLIVEAKLKSGTMITVDRALEQGKDVFAVPGRITDRNSDGCHRLIKQGAQLVTDPGEILAAMRERAGICTLAEDESGQRFFASEDETSNKIGNLPLASDEKMVYATLRSRPKSFDQLVWECGLSPAVLLRALYLLEQNGRIRRTQEGMYQAEEAASVLL